MLNNTVEVHKTRNEPWKVTMLYTGQDTMTAGRIKKAQKYVGDETFLLTYGDGVSDVDINDTVKAHNQSGKYCSMTAIQPVGRFGALDIDNDNIVHSFMEKPKGDGAWINAGFFVCEPQVFDYIKEDTMFEKAPLENLARDGQLHAYKHNGFWQPMDTLRDKNLLTDLWQNDKAPWAKWVGQ